MTDAEKRYADELQKAVLSGDRLRVLALIKRGPQE